MAHATTVCVWSHRSNHKHAHHGNGGTRYCNHWYNVYKCPTCGRCYSHRRLPIVCRGDKP